MTEGQVFVFRPDTHYPKKLRVRETTSFRGYVKSWSLRMPSAGAWIGGTGAAVSAQQSLQEVAVSQQRERSKYAKLEALQNILDVR
jgi:hypothetical protein